ncbi:MAG: DNA-3-methyladenine glycosylase 2 family protein [Taibaiella sp.]|nr:DNA-3-methyladenine glycosylase 2 family protein [Taibaiella sp.]
MNQETTRFTTFNSENFRSICDELAVNDSDLGHILQTYGYPPMWARSNSFETLVHIILEQQVSLASALATLNKLKQCTGNITPDKMLSLDDEAMRACYVSRQKAGYIRGLAMAINNRTIDLTALAELPDDSVRAKLIRLKGIGHWTIDVYLMFALQRADLFPIGDLAAVNALRRLKQLDKGGDKEVLTMISDTWRPFRSVASMMLWHYYLSRAKNKS